jgi:phage shock protein A
MLNINIKKALEIHKIQIRKKREVIFKDLDIEFMKALEQGNSTLAAEVAAKKQALRDATNIESGSISTLEEIKSLWGENLLGETPYK